MVLALDVENEQRRAVVQTLKDMIFGARSERLAPAARGGSTRLAKISTKCST
jgi:hypothetical protein